ncbi:hypothetical protein ACFX2B_009501 [Malus domestica]
MGFLLLCFERLGDGFLWILVFQTLRRVAACGERSLGFSGFSSVVFRELLLPKTLSRICTRAWEMLLRSSMVALQLTTLQVDNNFGGTTIPDSYSNMSTLFKLSLRNCNLQGPIPGFSRIPNLGYAQIQVNQADKI